MCPIQESANRADVNDGAYTGNTVAVGTSQVEIKVGASRNPLRQLVHVVNDNDTTEVYLGPTGVTASGANKGAVLWPRQEAAIPIGDVGLYAIAPSGTVNLVVQEYS